MRLSGAAVVGAVVVAIAGGSAAGWFVLQPEQGAQASATPAAGGGRGGGTPTGPGGGPQPATGAGARSAVRADWVAFFAGGTPLRRRQQLLQDGSRFRPALQALLGSPMAAGASASVASVQVGAGHDATVTYTIAVDGQPALRDQHGTAVRQGGRWVVADTTLCDLVSLLGDHPPACAALAPGAGAGSSATGRGAAGRGPGGAGSS